MAKVKVIIKDPIPVEAKRIWIYLNTTPAPTYPEDRGLPAGIRLYDGQTTIGTHGSLGYYGLETDVSSLAGTSNLTSEFYLLSMAAQQISIRLVSADINNATLTDKLLSNVSIEPNKKTVVTGNLFDQLNTGVKGVNVNLSNPEWSGDSILRILI